MAYTWRLLMAAQSELEMNSAISQHIYIQWEQGYMFRLKDASHHQAQLPENERDVNSTNSFQVLHINLTR
jgi:hypothetical protein